MEEGSSDPVLQALLDVGGMGLCLFDAAGVVLRRSDGARNWAPPIGASIEDAPLFVGLAGALVGVREGRPFTLPSVALEGRAEDAIDVRVVWVEALGVFMAASQRAAERVAMQVETAQLERDNRLLQEKVREQAGLLAEQSERMRLFVRHAPAAVAMLDQSLDILLASERWRSDLGGGSGEPAEPLGILANAQVREAVSLAMDSGVPAQNVEKLARDGGFTWLRWVQTPWRRMDRSVGGSLLFVEDVTQQMRTTGRVRALSETIKTLSRDSRESSEALTRQLRGAMLQIGFFSDFLNEAVAQTSLDLRRAYAAQLSRSVERVNLMVAAFDRFNIIAHRDHVLAPVSLATVMRDVVASLATQIAAGGAQVHIGPLEPVTGRKALLETLFANVIENAVRHAGGAPSITIDCEIDGEDVIVSLADDGPGLPLALKTKAFDFFERLDARSQTPGVGMGLTISRKIAALHGGGMTLDAGYELGLRVLVRLPRAP